MRKTQGTPPRPTPKPGKDPIKAPAAEDLFFSRSAEFGKTSRAEPGPLFDPVR
jgi:hypothetical protein